MPVLSLAATTSMITDTNWPNCQGTQLRNGYRTSANTCEVKAASCRVAGKGSRAVAAHKTHTTELAHVRGYKRAHSRCPALPQLLVPTRRITAITIMSRALKPIQKPFLHCCPPPKPSHLPGTRTHTHIAQCRNGPGTQLTERQVDVGFSYSPYACTCVNSERCVGGRGRGCSSDQQWHNCGAVTAVLCGQAALRCRSIL